ncbi:class D beta-lactamase [Riemerella anatipestifer]|nr:Beta-lactamase class D [Riemerella anatipestifer RA-CH-2]AKP70452.1 Beta-lactamase class D [Riemerella anatipestifer]AKQ38901.1 beta-lactamase [Riemerella anatipestifer Yb2]QXT33297.1 class D beta-lactamase [Riemerella anatipestifer RA-YM]MBT0526193.1 class D beta-lactamase [Riemerella anatipestifer]
MVFSKIDFNMKTKIVGTVILIFIEFISCHHNKSKNNWKSFFKDNNVNGTFVLKKLNSNETLIYNQERSDKKYTPASTFKILNSMIALQVLSVTDVNDTIQWDGIDRGYESWNKDQTMKSALPISCVWFYQELARRTGQKEMQKWLTKSNYGNKKIGSKIDKFWLDGTLAISANEQIVFLEKLINNKLPFDKNIQESVKKIMITDSTEHYIIHSKTGWGNNIGWNIGYIETKNNIWIFALNMDMNDIKMADIRKKITYNILKDQKIIQ